MHHAISQHSLRGIYFLPSRKWSKTGLTRVANPQQDAVGLQTRLNVGGAWEVRGRHEEDTCEICWRHVVGTYATTRTYT